MQIKTPTGWKLRPRMLTAGALGQSSVNLPVGMKIIPLRGALCALVLCLAAPVLLTARPAAAQDATGTPTPTAPATAEAPLPPPGDWRYGVIESYEEPEMASHLGASWTRVRFQWAEVQADGPDSWEPLVSDEEIDAELAAGREVVGLLIGVPRWARDRKGLPKGLYLPATDPDNTWATFVREAVGRYEGRINHWVIWNEPDINDPDAPGHTWDGTVEDFAQLQRIAYLAAKEANPEAVIHLAAFTYFWDPAYFGRFLDELLKDPDAAAHNEYFDVATAHLYFQPNGIYDLLRVFTGAMEERGLWKPIWLVETNAPPIDDPYWRVPNWTLSVTLNEQAAFIPQALASALAAGAERIAVFKLMDTKQDRQANPEPFGLVRVDTSRRPAYNTYQLAIKMLANAGWATRQRWDGVGQIRVEQGDRSTTVLFSRLPFPQQAVVRAEAPTAELVDMWGKRKTLTAENGRYTIDLQAALCTQPIGDYCMIGGTAYYLVQASKPGSDPLGHLPAEDVWATPDPAVALAQANMPVQASAPAQARTTPRPRATATASPTLRPTTTAESTGVSDARTMAAAPIVAALPTVRPQPAPDQEAPPDQSAEADRSGGVMNYAGLVVLGLTVLIVLGWGAGYVRNKQRAARLDS